jgi:hypothetical protein
VPETKKRPRDVAKPPLAKDIEEFDFTGTPINEGLVRELASGSFVADQRNVVLIGGTGTGKILRPFAVAGKAQMMLPASSAETATVFG